MLELAEVLGNVSEACRRRGTSRTQFYEYKRRFQTHGIEGLRDLPPVHKWHPITTPPEVVEKILAMSLEHPMWGCVRLSHQLRLAGISVSSPTIQNILIKHGMGSWYQRLLKLEERASKEEIELTAEQVAAVENTNPCFRERHVQSEEAREFRPRVLSFDPTEIRHHKTRVGRPQTNGLAERFNRTALGESFRKAFREKFYASAEALQEDMDGWLKLYNEGPPHQCYRNMGKRPIDTIKKFANLWGKSAS